MTSIAIVIPYYQRKAGILRRALTSVLAQDLPADTSVTIIVTDDGSPSPPEQEIDDLGMGPPFRLILRKQANAGVAAARNTCLDSIPEGTTFVAFLDSDDIWAPTHLKDALTALSFGCDYYFCDNQRIDSRRSYFPQTSFNSYADSSATKLDYDDCYKVDAANFFSFSVRTWVSLIPTVVYRWSIAPSLRFNPSLKVAGEDCVFLMDIIARSKTVCFSKRVNVTCADGVNIFYSRHSWDDPGHLLIQLGQLFKLYEYLKVLPLSGDDRSFVNSSIRKERNDFAFFTVRFFLKFRSRWPAELVDMTRQDPGFWQWYPLRVLYVLIGFPLKLYAPLKSTASLHQDAPIGEPVRTKT